MINFATGETIIKKKKSYIEEKRNPNEDQTLSDPLNS